MAKKTPIVDKIVAKYGIPDRLYVDNGCAFTSTDVRSRLTALGITAHFASPYSVTARTQERHFIDVAKKKAGRA